jgi:hypothetical protein
VFTSTDEYDRLIESSPVIDKDILLLFNKTFKTELDLSKPEVLDTLITVKRSVYKKDNEPPIQEFIEKFTTEFSRQPTREECISNLSLPSNANIDKYLNYV